MVKIERSANWPGKQRGLGLIGMFLALTIGAVAIAYSVQYYRTVAKAQALERYARMEAQELNDLARAAEEWAPKVASRDNWQDDQEYWLDFNEMIAAGLLPQGWAYRFQADAGADSVGISPIGKRYIASAVRSTIKPGTDDGTGNPLTGPPTIRLVIFEVGDKVLGKTATEAGYSGNPASLPQWMKVYASRVVDEYTRVSGKNNAGVVDANSTTANAPKGGFSYDLSAWLSGAGAFSNASPAILAGWPEIDGGDPDTPTGNTCRRFEVITSDPGNPNWDEEAPSCSAALGAGWTELVAWHPCAISNSGAGNNWIQDIKPGDEPLGLGVPELGNYIMTGIRRRFADIETCPDPNPGANGDPCDGNSTYQTEYIEAFSTMGSSGEVASQVCETKSWAWFRNYNGSYTLRQTTLKTGCDTQNSCGNLYGSGGQYYMQARVCCLAQ